MLHQERRGASADVEYANRMYARFFGQAQGERSAHWDRQITLHKARVHAIDDLIGKLGAL